MVIYKCWFNWWRWQLLGSGRRSRQGCSISWGQNKWEKCHCHQSSSSSLSPSSALSLLFHNDLPSSPPQPPQSSSWILNHDHDNGHLQTTPGKPFSLSSSTSSLRPRTVSTLFKSHSYFSSSIWSWFSSSSTSSSLEFHQPSTSKVYLVTSSALSRILIQQNSMKFLCLIFVFSFIFIFFAFSFTFTNVLTWIWLGSESRIFCRAERQSPALLGSPCKIPFIITTSQGLNTVLEIVNMLTLDINIWQWLTQWLLTAPVVDPIGLPPIPMPIPLKRNGFFRGNSSGYF